jgi:anti-anti-sigma regulatory factor
MEMRLTIRVQDTGTVLHADGRLSRLGVTELERAVRMTSGPVTLDLTNLFSADDAGVAALRSISGRGVQLVGVSPYMALLLEAERR